MARWHLEYQPQPRRSPLLHGPHGVTWPRRDYIVNSVTSVSMRVSAAATDTLLADCIALW